ncbi:TonB-dependent receptor plug domain-containing protein, partial [Phenylobacterium sp.]|uniref:TonB-dependent receptor n=1 Tax=Phenylobacterium sp. TaxID=1871053 RepID=UPI0025DDAD65
MASLAVPTWAAEQASVLPTTNPGGGQATLEEVVVTARKVTEDLQEAPASIVAVSGSQLQAAGVVDVQGLEKFVPSANLRSEGPVVETFIRGVGSNIDSANVDEAVSYNYNGIVLSRFATAGLLFDVANVQVIAGPQGTLYGGTAAGGAINVTSARPKDDAAGAITLEGGNYARAHFSGFQDIPVSDMLSVRGAIDYDRRDGYETYGFDAQDSIRGRLSALITPNDSASVLVFASGSYDDGKPAVAINNPLYDSSNPWKVAPAGPTYANPVDPNYVQRTIETYVFGANADIAMGDNHFTYIPGFVHNIIGYQTYIGYFPHPVKESEAQVSQELRWNRRFDALALSAGVFYLHDSVGMYGGFGAPILPKPPYIAVTPSGQLRQDETSYAVFGQGVYSVTDKLRLT